MQGVAREQHPARLARGVCAASISIALICTTSRQIPASSSTNQGTGKNYLLPLLKAGGANRGSEEGSYVRLIDFCITPHRLLYHSTVGLSVIKKTRRRRRGELCSTWRRSKYEDWAGGERERKRERRERDNRLRALIRSSSEGGGCQKRTV